MAYFFLRESDFVFVYIVNALNTFESFRGKNKNNSGGIEFSE